MYLTIPLYMCLWHFTLLVDSRRRTLAARESHQSQTDLLIHSAVFARAVWLCVVPFPPVAMSRGVSESRRPMSPDWGEPPAEASPGPRRGSPSRRPPHDPEKVWMEKMAQRLELAAEIVETVGDEVGDELKSLYMLTQKELSALPPVGAPQRTQVYADTVAEGRAMKSHYDTSLQIAYCPQTLQRFCANIKQLDGQRRCFVSHAQGRCPVLCPCEIPLPAVVREPTLAVSVVRPMSFPEPFPSFPPCSAERATLCSCIGFYPTAFAEVLKFPGLGRKLCDCFKFQPVPMQPHGSGGLGCGEPKP